MELWSYGLALLVWWCVQLINTILFVGCTVCLYYLLFELSWLEWNEARQLDWISDDVIEVEMASFLLQPSSCFYSFHWCPPFAFNPISDSYISFLWFFIKMTEWKIVKNEIRCDWILLYRLFVDSLGFCEILGDKPNRKYENHGLEYFYYWSSTTC